MGRDTNFYYSFLVLPPAKRRAIVTVWDFCRAVDDAVDERPEPPDECARCLEAWRGEVDAVFAASGAIAPATPQGRALQVVAREFSLSRQPFDDLIAGVAMDVGTRRFDTFDDLRLYCYRVASTIGLVCIEVFGVRQASAYAVDLGIALQLTNILRDVGADLGRGRLYVPLDELRRFGCGEDDLKAGRRTPAVLALLSFQAERAREYYAKARAARPKDAARKLVAAEIMAAIYRTILERIVSANFDVFSAPIRVPRPRRAIIALTTWARVVAGLA